jgi:hypothetical protein
VRSEPSADLTPPRRIRQDAAEIAASRSPQTRLIRCQLDDPAIGDQLAAGLGDEHLAQIIGEVGGELLAAITRLYPKDTHSKLNGGCDVRLRERLDLHRGRHAVGRRRWPTPRIVAQHQADYPLQPQFTVHGLRKAAPPKRQRPPQLPETAPCVSSSDLK